MSLSVREKQIIALKRMLNFNSNPTKTTALEPSWKILVYDRCGQDIISPLLSVRELREMGVTLHLLLHSDREQIPDVPCIYFIAPTSENISRISQDFRDHIYDGYYLNFISPISRQKLEDLASSALQSQCVPNINKVIDQYLNFISLEDNLFILKHQDKNDISFYSINRGDIKDSEMESIIDNIVDSLFSVFLTLGMVPVIRCPKRNAAEMVAVKLEKKIRENLRDTRNNLFTAETSAGGQFGAQRPLLVILDRTMDIATPLHHTWTYQALAHDVLDLQLNRIFVEETEKSSHAGAKARRKIKSFEVNDTDPFWSLQKGNPFPCVAEAVSVELEKYRESEEEVKRLKTAMGLEGEATDEAMGFVSDNTAKLTTAISSLPQLLEKKRLIDMHTTIATSILDFIKIRKLDHYFEIEEKVFSKTNIDKSIIDMITDPEAGNPEDKMRLFLIQFICGPTMSDAELDQYLMALEGAGCDLNPVYYIKRWKAYANMSNQYTGGGTKTIGMFSKLVTTGSQFVMEGVKNLTVKKHQLPFTRIVDALMELKSIPEIDDYRYLDPKLIRNNENMVKSQSTFQHALVFVVGGGNYIEFQNLMDYVKGKSGNKKIIYGCTDLMNSVMFLKQIAKLGEEIN